MNSARNNRPNVTRNLADGNKFSIFMTVPQALQNTHDTVFTGLSCTKPGPYTIYPFRFSA